jgi:aminoglycoside phosphotransferase family enzyme
MLCPGFYPHPVHEPVRLVQTHISYVLLTGQHAYKVKKPVNLGFLDFSTLEKRQFYCAEEIRLNSLYSPALYLEVLSIAERGGQFTFGSDTDFDTIVEYVVHMREFDDRDLLLNVFERGELNEDHIREIARKLADAHETAKTSDAICAYGRASRVAEMASENYEEIRPFIGTTETEQFFL